MKVKILNEHGIDDALLGLSLSFYDRSEDLGVWWDDAKKKRALSRAKKLAHMQGGHNKFLESMNVSIFVNASRDFWQEFDTYRVGTTKQSSSTMHTLSKRYARIGDFEVGTSMLSIVAFNLRLWQFKNNKIDITDLKKSLPEGWMQERVICTNYKVIQNIIAQRKNHKLIHWRQFCLTMMQELEHSEMVYK